MRTNLLILLSLLTVGCGQQPGTITEDAFIKAFRADGALHGKEIPDLEVPVLLVEKMPKETGQNAGNIVLGMCQESTFSHKIFLNKGYWDEASDDEREVLMYHELGHCLLNRGHDTQVDSLGEPLSIMFSDVTKIHHYRDRRQSYLKELFK